MARFAGRMGNKSGDDLARRRQHGEVVVSQVCVSAEGEREGEDLLVLPYLFALRVEGADEQRGLWNAGGIG